MSINVPNTSSAKIGDKPSNPSIQPIRTPIIGKRETPKITRDEIGIFSKYIHNVSGIHIDATKAYLLETRLAKLLEAQGCRNYSELCQKAKMDATKGLEKQIIDAITTNETLFFRDGSPFELLRHKILPELIDKHSKPDSGLLPRPIRIWSAACSTGQEVFSMAIVLKELLGDVSKYNIQLVGTDISNAAIKQASYGAYNKFEIERGLTQDRLMKYFSASGGNWKINDEIRSMVSFRKMNLMEPFQGIGRFDIILCRNVAIYFTLEDRKSLFNKIAATLEPDGYLIIGSTESLTGVCPKFMPKRHLKSIFYQLK